MLNRRVFIGACCAFHLNSGARAQQSEFACGTVDNIATSDQQIELDRYSSDAGFDRQILNTIVQEFKLTQYGTANLGHRWRRSDGLTPNTGVITLGVHFLNGSDGQKAVVRQAATAWLSGELGTKINFRFDVPRPSAQISVLFGSNGNNSIVGRASADYARFQTTMNLQDIVDHIIVHEFGHALGLQHEHQNPGVAINWNKPVVVAEMAAQGWTPQMCEANIFARYGQNYTCGPFDKNSIMLYPIPSRWTLNNFSSGTNASISGGDRGCMTAIYQA